MTPVQGRRLLWGQTLGEGTCVSVVYWRRVDEAVGWLEEKERRRESSLRVCSCRENPRGHRRLKHTGISGHIVQRTSKLRCWGEGEALIIHLLPLLCWLKPTFPCFQPTLSQVRYVWKSKDSSKLRCRILNSGNIFISHSPGASESFN